MQRTIWPLGIRLLHALLAGSVIVSFATQEVDGPWHEWPGYAALLAACLRLAWGVLPATRHAPARYIRLAQCLQGPRATWRFLCRMARRREPRHLGHNPVAAWLVAALLLDTAVCGATGAMMVTDRWFGIAWVMDLHAWTGIAIAPLVLVHWSLIAHASVRHRENLVASMWHGRKSVGAASRRTPDDSPDPDPTA